MPLKRLADEDIDFRIVKQLRSKGIFVVSVLEDYKGLSDKEVLELSKGTDALLLTEDKDFGEWIFAHKEKCIGVIFLRYKPEEIHQITDTLINLLYKYGESLLQKFTVLRGNKLRIRGIS
ncbi:MAG: DUF5615 family PIN-like protein [bacterium]